MGTTPPVQPHRSARPAIGDPSQNRLLVEVGGGHPTPPGPPSQGGGAEKEKYKKIIVGTHWGDRPKTSRPDQKPPTPRSGAICLLDPLGHTFDGGQGGPHPGARARAAPRIWKPRNTVAPGGAPPPPPPLALPSHRPSAVGRRSAVGGRRSLSGGRRSCLEPLTWPGFSSVIGIECEAAGNPAVRCTAVPFGTSAGLGWAGRPRVCSPPPPSVRPPSGGGAGIGGKCGRGGYSYPLSLVMGE